MSSDFYWLPEDVQPDVYDMCEDYEVLLFDILDKVNPEKQQQVTQADYDAWRERFKYAGYSPEVAEELKQAAEHYKYHEQPYYLVERS